MTNKNNVQVLENEIHDLESRLRDAKSRLALTSTPKEGLKPSPIPQNPTLLDPTHALLLLSDTALPLGSFAYSSGLESYIAHNKPLPRGVTPTASFHRFLTLSIASMASTSIPYVLAAYRTPEALDSLDNDLDASTPCVVAQRASIAQGRALIGVWERAFRATYAADPLSAGSAAAAGSVERFSDAIKSGLDGVDQLGPKGHFAPLWGVVCVAMGVDVRQTAYVFMLNHAKAVLSAAVRASVMGPYQAQRVLASKELQEMIAERIDREWETAVEDAGQVVPPLDLWVGRHELLYSRIFNS
ncbi:urease accessory protein UreF [Aspergillus taichungensis]|uniref:Urease accessory protein UreF n=1 Tax=Aspergillus taichungensis TaxID=482145 RepID=A0A2J5I138_9EURO|nr:urease accessory protein UreF [Aspergillus taichungensis]